MRTALLALSLTALACQKQAPANSAVAEVPAVTDSRADAPWAEQYVELLDNFKRVHFETDSAALTDLAKRRLDRAAAILDEHPTVSVVAMGHADQRGDAAYNRALAKERAENVVAYLKAKGVEDRQVQARSAGESAPRVDRDTHRAFGKNRRVEFLVVWDPYNEVDGSEDNGDLQSSWIPDTHF